MIVSDYFKQAYENHMQHDIEIRVSGKIYTNEDILLESFELHESLCDEDSLDFIGCVSNQMKVTVTAPQSDIRGKLITAEVWCTSKSDPDGSSIELFTGYVSDVVLADNRRTATITAYDALYFMQDLDVAPAFADLIPYGGSKTLKQIRDAVFSYANTHSPEATLVQNSQTLPNDNMSVGYDFVSKLSEEFRYIDFVKSICQINGMFGIVNRSGRFEYRKFVEPDKSDDGAYPGSQLITPFIPGVGYFDPDQIDMHYPNYRNIKYADFKVKKIQKVSIRQTDDAKATSSGSGKPRYIVQGNPFTRYLSGTSGKELKQFIARNILDNIDDIEYIPYTATNEGWPWIEVGLNWASYTVYDHEKSKSLRKDTYKTILVPIVSRVLKGIQAPVDSFSANGLEENDIIVTDLGFTEEIDGSAVEKNTEDIAKNTGEIAKNSSGISELSGRLSTLEGNMWNVQSVAALPANPDPRTIYLIQGSAG